MYVCESWTIKKAECWRIDAFELWCWRRLLRVSWTARKSNQSILKEINPEYSLEGLMLKLKLQYSLWPPYSRNWLIGKDPDAGKDWGQEEKGTTEEEMARQHHWHNQWTWVCKLWEMVKDREAWHAAVHEVTKSWTQLSNWMTNLTENLKFRTHHSSSVLLLSNSEIMGNSADLVCFCFPICSVMSMTACLSHSLGV